MPLLCPLAVATAILNIDTLKCLCEGPDGPIDMSMAYSSLAEDGSDGAARGDVEDMDNPGLIFAAARMGNLAVLRYI